MSEVFVSYARSTEAEAQRIAEALRALGYRVWRDDELPAHRSYGEVIEERLRLAKAVVVIWSAEAVKSEWVQSEADRARNDRKLVQITLDGAPLPMPFDRIQCADLSAWNGDLNSPGWRKVEASIAELTAHKSSAQESSGQTGASQAAARRQAICVLPFANISDDPQQEYFSDGISEDIITDLSKVSALSVVARNTAFTFKGKPVDVAQIARQLGVSHILEGSVRKAGNRVRITAQLIDGAVGDHIWAERWDRDLTDIFAVQDEISRSIVAALKLKLLPAEKKAIEQRGTASAEAYNLFLMARHHLDTGNMGDPRREPTIARLCRRATEIDPGYARAWALMGYIQGVAVFNYGREGDDGSAATERAIEIDPDLAEPYATRARALKSRGQMEAAFAEIEHALQLDPDSNEVNSVAAEMYYDARRFADAVVCFAKVAAASEADYSSPGVMMSAYIALGDSDNARRAAQMALERVEKVVAHDRNNGGAMATGVNALAALGETERARGWIDQALLIDPDNQLMRYNFACALAVHLADAEGAVELLKSTIADGPQRLVNGILTDPDFDPIRDDPRFKAILPAVEARLAN
jgi:adenylate cyclase